MKYTVKAIASFRFQLVVEAEDWTVAQEIARDAIYENGYSPMSPVIIGPCAMDEILDWENDVYGECEILDMGVSK